MKFYLGNDVWADVLGDGSVNLIDGSHDEPVPIHLDPSMVADLISKLKDQK